ncbi:hypothetical protein GmHk_18G052267 [Glycine max]|uniref:uncharacterized protein n=1 Tax=Glycine max TaxID=3847 RepID=UPI00023DA1F4|nr:uncharacterized protein LOC121173950 [Glycine max]KAH1198755.1 hypothetical protein GmHk_18G052267 [Glycine max]
MAKYPRLYHISNQQHQLISSVGSQKGAGWEWNFSWRRSLFENEIGMAAEFLEELAQVTIHHNRPDLWVWKADPSGNYSTKSAYQLLVEATRGVSEDRTFVELWNLKIPFKAAVFAWRLIKDCLPTRTNLRTRQVELNDLRCPLCNSPEEDAAHLFFHCTKTLPLWWESQSWVNSSGVFPHNPKDHFWKHDNKPAARVRSKRWKCWWVALTWTIWKHRNEVVFDNQSFDGSKVINDALFLLWSWLKVMEKGFTMQFSYWSSHLKAAF